MVSSPFTRRLKDGVPTLASVNPLCYEAPTGGKPGIR